ncbi:MAG: ArsR/SmtB-type metalloregulator TsoR [Thermodesulfobacteriota bacterium]
MSENNKKHRAAAISPPDVAFLAKALADENRLRIILLLTEGKKSVSTIVEEMGISQPLVSHHLKELKRALLVKVERSGPFIYYELADRRIVAILSGLHDIATGLLANRTTFSQ